MEINNNLSDESKMNEPEEDKIIVVEGKQKTKEYNKQYYIKNKTKILAQVNKKVECTICNKITNHQHFHRHQLSSFCQLAKLRKENDSNLLRAQC